MGFEVAYRGDDWLILGRGPVTLEFFAAPIVAAESWHSACWRTDNLDGLMAELAALNLPVQGIPRLDPPRRIMPDLRMAALVDPDGSLVRILGR